MTVKLTRGDLLQQGVDAIVNPVNTVGVVGKGIALQFKQKWPENFKAYESVSVVKCSSARCSFMMLAACFKPRYIIKQHWRGKSQLEDIETELEDLGYRSKTLAFDRSRCLRFAQATAVLIGMMCGHASSTPLQPFLTLTQGYSPRQEHPHLRHRKSARRSPR